MALSQFLEITREPPTESIKQDYIQMLSRKEGDKI